MDIVLGVSMAPTTVRMVLVEGEKGDGATVDHDVFEVSGSGDSATPTAADQVVQAVLGTQESAQAGGHHLTSIGVTWSDHTEASALRESLAAHGINDVMLVSELHAAGALAQAAGRAVGYSSTALLFLDRDTATLSVVRADDGSVVKVLSRSLHSTDAMAVLADMAAAVAGQDTAPEGMFVVGSGVDVASVKEHLASLVDIPVSAPEESGLALARGAALASASAPAFEASTVGLAYSLDPDGPTAGSVLAADADTQLASSVPNYAEVPDDLAGLDDEPPAEQGHRPFLLVGSMASIFVIGVVALAISLAVSIRPTADERPAPARAAVAPSVQAPAPAPAPAPEALPAPPAPPPPPAAAETIKAPIPVVQQAPQPAPRQVYVERAPAPQAPAPAPAPVAPPPAPAPVAPPVVPPVWTPPVVLPPPVIVLPRPQWPVWRPPWEQKPRQTQQPDYPDYDDDDYPGYPQQPKPQPTPSQQPTPQQPQQPQWPWPTGGNGGNGGNGSGSGSSEGSRGDSGSRGDYGRGESGGRGGGQGGQGGGGQGGNCFLIFCN